MDRSLAPLVGGLLGTLFMTLFLLIPRWLKIGHVDIIRAAGALATGKVENAYPPGCAIHFGSGILFAYIYVAVIHFAKLPINFMTCGLIGAVHGIIVMLLVTIMIMEHHPVAKYHDRGPMTALMQLLAHIFYGMIVGGVVNAMVH
ncbi:MAG: DUF6789 family protein [Chthoniobacterales bacterium]